MGANRPVDNSGIGDEVEVTLTKGVGENPKGPDPAVWGSDEERPQSGGNARERDLGGLGIGEIRNAGTPEEVKGPGPEWEQSEQGEYINR
jgi:hypothetical protein